MADYKWFFEIFHQRFTGPSEKMAESQQKLQEKLGASKQKVTELEAKVESAGRKMANTKLAPQVYDPNKKVGPLPGINLPAPPPVGTPLLDSLRSVTKDKSFAVTELGSKSAAAQQSRYFLQQEKAAEKAAAQLEKQKQKLEAAREKAAALEKKMGETKAAAGGLDQSLGSFGAGLPGVLAGVAALTVALGALAVAAGVMGGKWAVNTLAMKESTLATLKVTTGSVQQADKVFREALVFAKKTPFQTGDVVQGYTSLLGAGFNTEQVGKVYAALGDVAAMSGFDKYVIDRLTLTFSQIKAKGKLQGEEMLQVLEASGKAGVGATAVYEQIAKRLGIATNQVADAISKGKVDSDTGILAILGAIQKRSGGKVGNLMLEQSETLTGLFSTLQSGPEDLLLSLDMKKLPGLDSFKGFIKNLIQLFDSGSKSGQRLQEVGAKVFNTVFGALFGDMGDGEGYKKLEAGLGKFLDLVDKSIPWFAGLISAVKGFASGIFDSFLKPLMTSMGKFYGGLARDDLNVTMQNMGERLGTLLGNFLRLSTMLLEVVLPLFERLGSVALWVSSIFDSLSDSWFGKAASLGASLAQGLASGIFSMATGPVEAMGWLVDMVTGKYKEKTETHSPSRLFARYGEWAVEGYTQGLEKGTPEAVDAVGELGDAPADALDRGPVGRGATPSAGLPPIHLHFYIQGQPDNSVVDQIEERMRSALEQIFADWATQVAGAGAR